METKKLDQWAVALAAALLTTVVGLPQARGELVYEDNAPTEAPRVEDRGALRQALSSAERSRATREAEAAPSLPQQPALQQPVYQQPALQQPVYQQPVYQQPVYQQPVYQQPALQQPVAQQPALETVPVQKVAQAGDSAEDMRNMNKSELLRRQRVREELRNEDSLQERLEELRLRDERRRTDQILGVAPGSGEAAGTAAGQQSGSAPNNMPSQLYGGIQEQTISAPVTERPGQSMGQSTGQGTVQNLAQNPGQRLNAQQAPAPLANAQQAPAPAGGVQLAGVSSVMSYDQAGNNQSSMNASLGQENGEKSSFYIQPRAGMGSMQNTGGYDIHPRFAGGIGVGIDTSDYLSFEVGYTYAEYGVAISSGNPFVQQIQMMQTYGGNPNFDTLVMKQNVVDAGLKVHLLDSSSKLRPFVGGGGAYAKSYINYDQSILNSLGQLNNMGGDYQLTSYLGYLSTGLDVKMNKSMSIGLLFKYYAVLSSQQNNNLNNYAFFNQPYASGYGQDPAKQYVGGSVSRASFYSLLGGVSFTF